MLRETCVDFFREFGKNLVARLFSLDCLFLRFQFEFGLLCNFSELVCTFISPRLDVELGLNCGFTACWLRPKGANMSHEIEARSDGLDQCCNDFIFISVRIHVCTV